MKKKLIIWDESPMIYKYCFEALDSSLENILQFMNPTSLDIPFGGKVMRQPCTTCIREPEGTPLFQ